MNSTMSKLNISKRGFAIISSICILKFHLSETFLQNISGRKNNLIRLKTISGVIYVTFLNNFGASNLIDWLLFNRTNKKLLETQLSVNDTATLLKTNRQNVITTITHYTIG